MKGIKSHGKRYHSLDFNTIPLLSTGTCEMVHFIKIHFSFNRRKKKEEKKRRIIGQHFFAYCLILQPPSIVTC